MRAARSSTATLSVAAAWGPLLLLLLLLNYTTTAAASPFPPMATAVTAQRPATTVELLAFNVTTAPPMTADTPLGQLLASLQRVADAVDLPAAVNNKSLLADLACGAAIAIVAGHNESSLIVVSTAAGAIVPATADVLALLQPLVGSVVQTTTSNTTAAAAGSGASERNGTSVAAPFAFVCARGFPSISGDGFVQSFLWGDAYSGVHTSLGLPFVMDFADGAANASTLRELLALSALASWNAQIDATTPVPTPAPTGDGDGGGGGSGLSTGNVIAIAIGAVCGTLLLAGFIAMRRKMRDDAEYEALTGGPPKMVNGSPLQTYLSQVNAQRGGRYAQPRFSTS